MRGLTNWQRREGGEEAWLRWVAELENATVEEMPRFLEALPKRSGVAMDLIVERWLDLGPEHAWQHYQERFARGVMNSGYSSREVSLMRALVRRWAEEDLEGVLAAMEEGKALPYLQEFHRELAPRLAKVDPERGLRYALKNGMHRSGYSFFLSGEPLQRLIDGDPRVAAELIFEWDESRTRDARKQLIERWGLQNPQKAIRLGLDRDDGMGELFADEAFVAWAEEDYAAASAWVEGEASVQEASLFIAPLVDVWSREDPFAALQWAEEQLPGSELTATVKRLILGAIDREGVDAGELLRRVRSPDGQQEAAVALAEALWGSGSSGETSNGGETDRERLAWFDHITDEETINQLLLSFTRVKTEEGRQWLQEFARSERMALLERHRATLLIQQLQDPNNVGESFKLVEFVDERWREQCRADLFERWYVHDPDSSASWLEENPGTPQLRALLSQSMVERFFSSIGEQDWQTMRQFKANTPAPVVRLVREGLLQNVARARLEGHSNEEIERHLGKILQVLDE
ncbi:hypothetical protein [Roseibacillus ishigakijimensis]|uniref:Uncharacterized protein n=1 Tax=Roseibacillus ishigakijimensis TaxID=454146 RepID=A0A934RPQ4_9BACT|nr:hypothetical protein [Roseibacillus ishigakijimensis]MBK1833306.1 hypothetical protein [Roseibacillus ishigakijimensis]